MQSPLLSGAPSGHDEIAGRSFYFKINGKLISMTGSNWIPVSAYLSEISPKYENLLKSASEAGINMLRVRGGGIYESEEFYDLAAIYGICNLARFYDCLCNILRFVFSCHVRRRSKTLVKWPTQSLRRKNSKRFTRISIYCKIGS